MNGLCSNVCSSGCVPGYGYLGSRRMRCRELGVWCAGQGWLGGKNMSYMWDGHAALRNRWAETARTCRGARRTDLVSLVAETTTVCRRWEHWVCCRSRGTSGGATFAGCNVTQALHIRQRQLACRWRTCCCWRRCCRHDTRASAIARRQRTGARLIVVACSRIAHSATMSKDVLQPRGPRTPLGTQSSLVADDNKSTLGARDGNVAPAPVFEETNGATPIGAHS